MRIKPKILQTLFVASLFLQGSNSLSVTGELGIGIPEFGIYSNPTGGPFITVWALTNATVPIKTPCAQLYLSASYMGIESFKIAVGILTAAKLANKAVQFFSHYEAGGGCYVDYIRLAP